MLQATNQHDFSLQLKLKNSEITDQMNINEPKPIVDQTST